MKYFIFLKPTRPVAALSPADQDPADPPALKGFKRLFKKARRNWLDKNGYIELYYFQLLGEYHSLYAETCKPENAHLAQAARDICGKWETFDLEWHDVYDLETIILTLQPFEILQRRAWDLRTQYKQLVPAATYDAYLKSNPPDPASKDSGSEHRLRTDLLRLLEIFHWHYGITLTREATRANIFWWLSVILIIAVTLATLSLVGSSYIPNYPQFPTVVGVFITGMIGGFVSTLRRLQTSQPGTGEPVDELVELHQGQLAIIGSPILGGIFAVVLFVIFAGNLVQGDLFPKIGGPALTLHFETFWKDTGADSVLDFARLLIWSFLAGFAERLVPDALDRVAATNTGQSKNT